MEPAREGWHNEMRKYLQSIENLTQQSLNLIKRDRNNQPFDEEFKKHFLQRTNDR